jgi:hypothetical protein
MKKTITKHFVPKLQESLVKQMLEHLTVLQHLTVIWQSRRFHHALGIEGADIKQI